MKEYWQKLAARIDAMSLRERAMAFAIVALLLITLVDSLMLGPLLTAEKQKSQLIKLDQQQIAAMQAEIGIIVNGHAVDPDALARARLRALKEQSEKLLSDLAGLQQSLVPPDKMATLLQDLLKRNKRLKLVSLRTLPVTLLSEPISPARSIGETVMAAAGAAPRQDQSKAQPVPGEVVYRHSVELVVQGSYVDIVDYLAQLEGMPWRLYWAKAKLNVEEHPKVSLKLTLFTLSMDKKWLNI